LCRLGKDEEALLRLQQAEEIDNSNQDVKREIQEVRKRIGA